MGKPVILGRKTFDSIGKPLPGRHFVVLSRDSTWRAPRVEVARNPEAALQIAHNIAIREGADEIMVAGGSQLYTLYLDRAERIYRTLVCCSPEGDATFPDLGPEWVVVDTRWEDEGELQICFQRLEKRL